jgi:hypothetical protein
MNQQDIMISWTNHDPVSRRRSSKGDELKKAEDKTRVPG